MLFILFGKYIIFLIKVQIKEYSAIPGEQAIKQMTLKFDEVLLAMGDSRKNQEAFSGEASPGNAEEYSIKLQKK